MSESVDDYLKALYQLGEEPHPATPRAVATGELALALGVSPASASAMMKRLAAAPEALVLHTAHGGARLSPGGRRHALRVLRRHRLLEAFLHLHLGYAWDEVHEEADRLEHAVSDRFCEALAQFLGRPTQDPHGEPIPEADGTLGVALERALSELPVEAEARVRRVTTRDASLLRYLRERGLLPGARVRLSSRDPFGGSLRLVVEGRTVELGPEAAVALFLERGEDA
jgi:DtxR family Mn-dependent transcriptional regulator